MYAKSQAIKRHRTSSSGPSSSHQGGSSSSSHPEHNKSTTRPRPHVNPNITPRNKALMEEEQRENLYKDKLCSMCSDSSSSIYHHNFSSWSVRSMFLNMKFKPKDWGEYMCPICHIPEPVVVPASETRRIVLACSTMYGVWNKKVPDNTVHFDIDSIVGGKVKDMKRALEKNYLHMPNRMEIIVIAGLNNIGAGQKADTIIQDMRELRERVKEHSDRWGHVQASYVTFCTIPLAPKFCSLEVPPNPPEPEIAMWVPPNNFRNHFSEMKSLNDQIIALNQEIGLTGVRIDYHGIKRFNSGKFQHIFDTKPGSTPVWRETPVFKKLHFTMERKLKIVSHISTCFKENAERVKGHN